MSDYTLLSCVESVMIEPTELYGRFALGNFTKGQSLTIANALRRCLLSQVIGCSICFAEIQGIEHEYDSLPGMKESVLDLLFNLRQLTLKSDKTLFNSQLAYLNVQGPGIVRARDLKLPYFISVVDPNQYIATLSPNSKLVMKLIINCGKTYLKHNPGDFDYQNNINKLKQRSWFQVGYQPHNNLAYSSHWTKERFLLMRKRTQIEKSKEGKHVTKTSETNTKHSKILASSQLKLKSSDNNTRLFNDPLADHLQEGFHKQIKMMIPDESNIKKMGYFPIDAIFAPILKATYTIEAVSQTKEKIYLEIWTNGSIEPRQAIHKASKALIELFLPLQAFQSNDLMPSSKAQSLAQFKPNLTLNHNESSNFKLKKKSNSKQKFNKINTKLEVASTKQNEIETSIYWLKMYVKKHPNLILRIIKSVLKPKTYRVQVKFGVVRSKVIRPIIPLSASEKLFRMPNRLVEHRVQDRIIVKSKARTRHVKLKKNFTKLLDPSLIQAEQKLTKKQRLEKQISDQKQKKTLQQSLLYFKNLIVNVDISQLNFPYNIYLELKTNNVHNIEQLINLSSDQLQKMLHGSSKDIKSIQLTLKNYVLKHLTSF